MTQEEKDLIEQQVERINNLLYESKDKQRYVITFNYYTTLIWCNELFDITVYSYNELVDVFSFSTLNDVTNALNLIERFL